MHYTDTHCHLFWNDFDHDLDEVIARANAAGVTRIIVPGTTVETSRLAQRIAKRFEGVSFTAGVHPHDAAELTPAALADIAELASDPRCVAIGEIGLDYHYDFCPKEQQHAALHAQLALATERGLPVVLHNRESDEDLLAICREHQDGTLRGQFHCFSSDAAYAARVLELGFHISFTGNVTHKKSTLGDVLRLVPDHRLLIETDAPFMTPAPFRGKRNEPVHIPLIAQRFADERGQTLAEVASCTTANAGALFRLGELHAGE
jgi:TatD DNase family protein